MKATLSAALNQETEGLIELMVPKESTGGAENAVWLLTRRCWRRVLLDRGWNAALCSLRAGC